MSDDATTRIAVNGEEAVCDRSGALFFPRWNLLAVSDLHLEKASAFARRGVLLPPYDTAETLEKLAAVIDLYRPAIVVSLGDSFHDREGALWMPEPFREALAAMMGGRSWFWISGNHDPEPPVGLGGDAASELELGRLVFRHLPAAAAAEGEVAGHLHPCATIVARGRSVRRRCFASDGARLVMPAFGAFTGSLDVHDEAFGGLFRWERFHAYMLGGTRVFPIPAANLRRG